MMDSKVFKQEAKFVAGVAKINQFPKLYAPQIAFLGKSNVGKSTLINSICHRKSLARVSNTPGRTRQINFFSIAEKFLLADLPGYGFAKVSQKQHSEWEKLILYYLQDNEHLRMINLLVDARRGIKENDISAIELFNYCGKDFQVVLTKCDKLGNKEELLKNTESMIAPYKEGCNIICVSAKSGLGIKDLQYSITKAL